MDKLLPGLISDRLAAWGEDNKPAPVTELARRYNAHAADLGLDAVTEQTVYHWRNGRSLPSPRRFRVLADVLCLAPEDRAACAAEIIGDDVLGLLDDEAA